MVHTQFGENRDPFSSFFDEQKADFFYKKHKKLKIDNKWDTMQERRESKSWNFVESCGRRSPWCTVWLWVLVRMSYPLYIFPTTTLIIFKWLRNFNYFSFLDVTTHLSKRLRPSVCPLKNIIIIHQQQQQQPSQPEQLR